MTSPQVSESRILDILEQRYQEQGYTFVRYPSGDLLPPFLGSYRPDAIALGPTENVVIEIKCGPSSEQSPISKVAGLFAGHDPWKFKLVLADAEVVREEANIERVTRSKIAEEVEQVRSLIESRHYEAAFLLLWAALEATARLLEGKESSKPKLPRTVVEFLEREGLVSRPKSQKLRSLITKRNRIVHGALDQKVTPNDLALMTSVVQSVLQTTPSS